MVQNAAEAKKYEHISPLLAAPHWLPVRFQIDFKILLLTFEALNVRTPKHFSDLLTGFVPTGPANGALLVTFSKVPSSK